MSHSPAPAAILLVAPAGVDRTRAARHLRHQGVEVIQLDEEALLPFLEAARRFPRSVVALAGVVLLRPVGGAEVGPLPLARLVQEGGGDQWRGDPGLCELMGDW